MLNMWVFFYCIFWLLCAFQASGNIVLKGNNFNLTFDNAEANFGPRVKWPGKCGTLTVAEPLDACSPLTNKINIPRVNDTCKYPFVLIISGGCIFESKVWRAQYAGFEGAIVYDNENGKLMSMPGFDIGIWIYAVFVSKASGETLAKYAGDPDTELWILPNYYERLPISKIFGFSMLAIVVYFIVETIWMFWPKRPQAPVERSQAPLERPQAPIERPQAPVERSQAPLVRPQAPIERPQAPVERPQAAPRVREFLTGMSSSLVKAIPTLNFRTDLEDNSTSSICAICLEDYNNGEKVSVLPCRHKFHAKCVDTWLTTRKQFCPVCKRNVSSSNGEPPASESTPLLSN